MKQVYFDNNATTKVDPKVFNEMKPYFCEKYGNPNSLHNLGMECREALRIAYDRIYTSLNSSQDDDIIITANSTESNNTVLKHILSQFLLKKSNRNTVIISEIEHPSITHCCEYLEQLGMKVIKLPVNEDGVVSVESLEDVISDEVALVSVMWVNNETGLIMPVKKLCEVTHKYGALFHTDATQAIGKIKVDIQDLNPDFLTLTAHKFHGPKGVGALYIKHGIELVPLLHGGEQMGGLRAGTVDVASAVGLGLALKLAVDHVNDENNYVRKLRDRLEKGLREIDDVIIVGKDELRVPNTILVSFKGVEGEAMLWDMNKNGIYASTGSACASESLQANPTFQAMKIGEDLSHTGIRLSLSRFNTEEEVDYCIDVMKKAVKRLRELSSSYF